MRTSTDTPTSPPKKTKMIMQIECQANNSMGQLLYSSINWPKHSLFIQQNCIQHNSIGVQFAFHWTSNKKKFDIKLLCHHRILHHNSIPHHNTFLINSIRTYCIYMTCHTRCIGHLAIIVPFPHQISS